MSWQGSCDLRKGLSFWGCIWNLHEKVINKNMSHRAKCTSRKQKICVRIPNNPEIKTHPVWVPFLSGCFNQCMEKRATLLWSYLKWLWGIPLYQKYKKGVWVNWFLTTNVLMHSNIRCMYRQPRHRSKKENFKYTPLCGMWYQPNYLFFSQFSVWGSLWGLHFSYSYEMNWGI